MESYLMGIFFVCCLVGFCFLFGVVSPPPVPLENISHALNFHLILANVHSLTLFHDPKERIDRECLEPGNLKARVILFYVIQLPRGEPVNGF